MDFETTGLDLDRDAIVSYGLVPIDDGRVRVGGSEHQLIDPRVPPSPRSQRIHELRPLDLAGSPRIADAREHLAAGLAGRFLLAWFAEVEIRFLQRTFGGPMGSWRRRTIDVRNLALAAAGEPRDARSRLGYSLSKTAKNYGIPVENPHDALDDAFVTAELFLVLAEAAVGSDRRPTVRTLLRIGGA